MVVAWPARASRGGELWERYDKRYASCGQRTARTCFAGKVTFRASRAVVAHRQAGDPILGLRHLDVILGHAISFSDTQRH